jgi:hypothetical protein
MSNLSEEEIIDDINFCLEGEYITPEHYDAIQGLLNLYNKEKEKNKEYFAENQSLKYAIGNMLHKDIVKTNYISKDKIREFALSESQADTYHFKTVSLDRLLKFLEEE